MSESAPKVVPLAGARATEAPAPEGRGRLRWLPWLLAALLGGGLLLQTGRARDLGQRVVALEGDLAGARAELLAARGELLAFERHMEEVRGAVSGLRGELTRLEALVEASPGSAAAAGPLP